AERRARGPHDARRLAADLGRDARRSGAREPAFIRSHQQDAEGAMKGLGRAVAMTAGMGLLIAGCAAASHLNVLQPPSAPRSPNLVIPQAPQPRPRIQLGI